MLRAARLELARNALLVGLVLAIALLGVRHVVRRLTTDLESLERQSARFAAGDTLTPLAVRGAACEVATLADTLERARRQIQSDIERREEIQRGLEGARARAEAASQAKSRFLAVVSHELRTPLNGALGALELAARGALEAERQEYLAIARSCSHALLDTVNDILDFTELERGPLRPDLAPVAGDGLVPPIAQAHASAAAARGLELRMLTQGERPAAVDADRGRVARVIGCLVSNAIKFTARGSVEVCELWSRVDPQSSRLQVRVSDTGPGIEPHMLARIFEPFARADDSMSRAHGGAGLGLSVAAALARGLGGALRVESELGQGSTFVFELTLRHAEPPSAVGASQAISTEPRLLLLVEDNPVNAKIATRHLERLGFRVEHALDGLAALERFEAGRYAAVVMDCQMPRLDGYEATRRIRALERGQPRTPIVALTAHASSDDRRRALECGMDDYLCKPIDALALRRVLDAVISAA